VSLVARRSTPGVLEAAHADLQGPGISHRAAVPGLPPRSFVEFSSPQASSQAALLVANARVISPCSTAQWAASVRDWIWSFR